MLRIVFGLGLVVLPLVASAQEHAEPADDSHMAVAPAERMRANNPSAEHIAFMQALTTAEISAETRRQNDLEDARRVALVDLHWGLP